MPLVETKYFDTLVDHKPFFDQPVKNKQEAYEKLIEMLRYDDYTTRNLMDYLYHQNLYKLIGIDLSRQTHTKKVSFLGKLHKADCVKILCIAERQQRTILNFCRLINCNRII